MEGINMRVFITKTFKRFMRDNDLADKALVKAIQEIERGLHDGDLGGHLVKKRIARAGGGKRGGFRTILVYTRGKKAFFIHGFAKNDKDNIDGVELEESKKLAKLLLAYTDHELTKAITTKALEEVMYYG